MSTLRFTRIELRNWKNFARVDVPLSPRTIVVGPNASGKSNFLDAFRFLRDLVQAEGGGLAPAVNKVRQGMSKVRSLHARGVNSEVVVKVTVRDEAGHGWRYELAFTHQSSANSTPVVKREIVDRLLPDDTAENKLMRPDPADAKDKTRLTETAIESVNANQNFRPLAEFLRTVSYLHLVPQLLREGQMPLTEGLGSDQYGRDLLERMRQTSPRIRDGRLKRIKEILKAVTTQIEELKLAVDERGRPHLEAKFSQWRPQGAYQNETQLSDGTLRLIGLLWSLQEKAGPLLLEEPELSLHFAIVRRLAPFLARAQRMGHGRQVILSTHSEDLLMDPGIAAEEVLLVRPANEGSEIIAAPDIANVVRLMQAGVSAAEAILSATETEQMNLFDSLTV
jgi:predicted ATPase